MPPPAFPSNSPTTSQSNSAGNRAAANMGTLVAAMILLACACAFFVLVLVVNPFIIGILILPLVFGPLAVVQYLVWGRWLARMQAVERERESQQ